MNLSTLQKNWDLLASSDAMWAILSEPAKKNKKWNEREFFDSGIWEAAAVVRDIGQYELPRHKHRALDFGCGIGRVTQALAGHFDEVWGIDIAPTMIALARRYNPHGERCRFLLNAGPDLAGIPSDHFDFVYSNITLQHMEPRFAKVYIAEFVRVLAPGGAILFQLPAPGSGWQYLIWKRALRRVLARCVHMGRPVIEMYGVPREEVAALITRSGGRVVNITPDQSAGAVWESYRYWATK